MIVVFFLSYYKVSVSPEKISYYDLFDFFNSFMSVKFIISQTMVIFKIKNYYAVCI